MIRDALSSFLFTTASGITATSDKVGAAIAGAGTYFSDAIDTKTGGFGVLAPLVVAILWNAAANASGSNAVTFTVQISTDGTNYFDLTTDNINAVALTTTAKNDTTNIRVASVRRYFRLKIVVSGAGTSPVITIKSAQPTPSRA